MKTKQPGPGPPPGRALIDRFKISTLDACRVRLWWCREQHAKARAEGGWFAPDGYVAMAQTDQPLRGGVPAEVVIALEGGPFPVPPESFPRLFSFCDAPPPDCLLALLARLHLESQLLAPR